LAREWVYEAIRDEIMRGDLPPGTRLKEVELSERLGVSRTPVREAFHRLVDEGVVDLEAHRGVVVRLGGERELREIYGLRILLESYAAAQAALNCTEEDVAHLEQLLSDHEEAAAAQNGEQRIELLVQQSLHFHRAVVEASGNKRLIALARTVTELPALFKSRFWESVHQSTAALVFHRETVEAIRARDPQRAEAATKAHILQAFDYYMSELRAREAAANGKAPS
jgi:DNA-binding GntR family transcriptional regulator